MMKKGNVYINEIYAGEIQQNDDGFVFRYDKEYLNSETSTSVSLTLSLREEPYINKNLFPFFDGLIPEGWLLDIAEKNWKVNRNDRMELLLTVCYDCIGNVSIVRENS